MAHIHAPKAELEAIFARRRQLFDQSADPSDYIQNVRHQEDSPFCEFVGYVGEAGLVGCMIHPKAAKEGRDLRPEFQREICPSFDCKTMRAFKQTDDPIKESMLRFVSGMSWYHRSHFLRRSNTQ